MKFSIIIPTYNRGYYIEKTINSFIELNYPKDKYEIIIVDNNSTDNTKTIINNLILLNPHTTIKYFVEKKQGSHFARNFGSKVANFEYLYFTDDDMLIDPNCLVEFNKLYNFNSNISVFTGSVLPIWLDTPPKWVQKKCNNYILSLLNNTESIIISPKLKYVYSCHQVINKEVFFKTEGFNPDYMFDKYMGDGESGLNLKIQKLGLNFAYISNAITYHMIPKERFYQKYLNKRFENNGRAHTYTIFRENNKLYKLTLRIFKNILIDFNLDILKSIIMLREFSDLRFLLAKIFYWKGRIVFGLEILLYRKFRNFVNKRDWLSDPNNLNKIV